MCQRITDKGSLLAYIDAQMPILVVSYGGEPDYVTTDKDAAFRSVNGYIDVFPPRGGDRVGSLKWDGMEWTTDF